MQKASFEELQVAHADVHTRLTKMAEELLDKNREVTARDIDIAALTKRVDEGLKEVSPTMS